MSLPTAPNATHTFDDLLVNAQRPPKKAVLPPPLVLRAKGLFHGRDMSRTEAEAWHLRQAAKLAGKPGQAAHLFQAKCNRYWAVRG